MSVYVSSLVWSYFPKGGNHLVVALKLADNAHDDGTRIYPSLKNIAAKCKISRSTAKRCIKDLQLMGWLVLEKEGGGRKANEYRMPLDLIMSGSLRYATFEGGQIEPPAVDKPVDRGVKLNPQGGHSCGPSGGS